MNQYCEPCICELQLKPFRFLSLEDVFQLCCDYFKVKGDYIMARSRKRDRVLMRQMSMYMCRLFTTASLESVGHFFIGRDHTTVIHAINTVNDLCDTDEAIKERFESLKYFVRN